MQSKSKKFFAILTFLGIYLLSTGISFAVFDYLKKPLELLEKKTTPTKEENLLVDISGPKNQICPLNGQKYTQAEKDVWVTRRPLTVMIENHEEARPQSGLSSADVVYEVVAEGGITRFLAVYYCDAIARETIIGPVRSARTYFVDWASEYGETPLYVHVGGAHCDPASGSGCEGGAKADALGQIGDYGWEGENDLNQFSIGYPTFWRDYERIGHTVATEHTMYSTSERLWVVAKQRDWTNKDPEGVDWTKNFESWSFKDEGKEKDRNASNNIEFVFWEGYDAYKVKWEYDEKNNSYKRLNGGNPHLDLNNNQQLTVKNVAVLFMKESSADDGYQGNLHLLYNTTGEGKMLLFQDGQVIEGKWVKKSRIQRTKFYTQAGKELKFNPGKIWLEIVPTGANIAY